jgi:S1-C subfamily serine protease
MSRRFSIFVLLAVCMSIGARTVEAQAILDRVERLLRQQVEAPQDPAARPPRPNEAGYLGLLADDRQDAGKGVRIVNVAAGSPAAKAGLQTGDLITGIGDQSVRSMDDMARAVGTQPPGTTLKFLVVRKGTESHHDVVLGRRPATRAAEALPAPSEAAPQGPRLGIRTVEVNDEARRHNNLPEGSGAMVISITPGSGAERAGLPMGAIITAVDGQNITSPNELSAVVRRAEKNEVELSYVFDGRLTKNRVSLVAVPEENLPSPQLRARPPAPPEPTPPRPASASDDRISALEARIRELEQRIEKLEAKSGSGSPSGEHEKPE